MLENLRKAREDIQNNFDKVAENMRSEILNSATSNIEKLTAPAINDAEEKISEFHTKFIAVFLLILPPALLYIALQIFQAFEFYEYAAFVENHIFILAIIVYVIEYLILKYRYNVTNFL